MKTTTIRIKSDTKKVLNKLRIHKRETYDDILNRLIKRYKENKMNFGGLA